MPQTSRSPSPSSPTADAANDSASKSALPKDRPCPFCKQSFTSSSLGRHLDLYIKEKNPKPPDGIHNVDEIRAMRGKITRRQPKGSGSSSAQSTTAGQKRKASEEATEGSAVREDVQLPPSNTISVDSMSNGTAAPVSFTQMATFPAEMQAAQETAQYRSNDAQQAMSHQAANAHSRLMNDVNGSANIPQWEGLVMQSPTNGTSRINWQSTGVIPDLPHTIRSPPGSRARSIPAPHLQPPSYEQLRPPWQDVHTANTTPASQQTDTSDVAAAALKDVLHSLQRAHTRISQPKAYSFDLESMNYPALCLRLLAAPKSLFSVTPLEPATDSTDYWPLRGPPSAAHKPRLMQNIRVRLKMHTSLCPPSELRFAETRKEVEDGVNAEVDKICARYGAHIDAALRQWETYDEQMREEVWKLEILRYTSHQGTEVYNLERKLEATQDFVEELRGELGRLRETNVQLAVQAQVGDRSQLKGGLLNGALDAARPSAGPVVESATAKELEKMWDTGGLGGGGGWMDGVGSDKWDYDNVLQRYRKLLAKGRGPGTLWPGDAWRTPQVDPQPEIAASRKGGGDLRPSDGQGTDPDLAKNRSYLF